MNLSNYLEEKLIFVNTDGNNMQEVIINIVNNIASVEKNVFLRKDEIIQSVLDRENEISTSIGKNIAIPHARIENFNDFIIAVASLSKPFTTNIASTSKTDEVKLVFLIISDVLKNKNILKLMSAISKLTVKRKDIASLISKSQTAKEILNIIKEYDIEIGNKITAEDVLSPDIIPAKNDSTLENIAKRLILEKRSGLPVVSENGDFLGEITEKELIEFGMPKYLTLMDNLDFFTVGEPFEEYLINEKTKTIENLYRTKDKMHIIDKKTPIMEICFVMISKGMTRLYVVEDGKYIGVIERADIIKKILHI